MHAIINTLPTQSRFQAKTKPSVDAYQQPAYDCQEHGNGIKVVVYVPGVDAAGVEIEARDADLTVTARKPHFVRVNFTALHLESAQRDYRLRLRLGTGFNYTAMEAEISDGILTVMLPKQAALAGRQQGMAA